MSAILTNGDPAGGPIIASQTRVRINGKAIVRVGDAVIPHDSSTPHTNPNTMVTPTSHVRIDGVAICVAGALATCGHVGTATQGDIKA